MNSAELEIQNKVMPVFHTLKIEFERLKHKTYELGMHTRNELIDHVYSNYNNHEKLNAKRTEWEKTHFKCNIHKWLYDLFVTHIDSDGNLKSYTELLKEIHDRINYSVENEDYEIAETLTLWFKELPNPK